MLRWVLKETRWRLLAGLVLALTTPFWLPVAPAARLWAMAGAMTLAPWLVLGRDATRISQRLRTPLMTAPKLSQLVLAELLPAAVVVVVAGLVGAGGQSGLGLAAWGLFLVGLADTLDRRSARAGAAWAVVLGVSLIVWTAPLWGAGSFGQAWSPWPASLSVGLHPAGIALTGAGRTALQDPWFYRWTLSGVVEARPLPWFYGAALWLSLAGVTVRTAIQAARHPPRVWARGQRDFDHS